MRRIVKDRSSTETKDFTFTPTGTPTLTLTRVSDGTAVTTSTVSGAGEVWSYTIPASSNTLLDTYVETWTATTGSQPQVFVDYIEVAGDVLFTLEEARAVKPLDNTTVYPTTKLSEMRTTVEQAIEDEYGTALVPRFRRETFSGDGTTMLRVRDPVRTIRSVTVNDTDLSAGEIADLTSQYGFLTGYTWATGIGNIVIDYEYGLDQPPGRIKMDAIRLAKTWLVQGPIDDRAATFNAGADGGTYSLVVPGRNGSFFGLPDLDAVIAGSPYRLGVA